MPGEEGRKVGDQIISPIERDGPAELGLGFRLAVLIVQRQRQHLVRVGVFGDELGSAAREDFGAQVLPGVDGCGCVVAKDDGAARSVGQGGRRERRVRLPVSIAKLKENLAGLRDIKPIFWRVLPVFIVAELVNLSAEFTLNYAIDGGPVSLVKAIESIQPMFVLLIALLLYPFAPRFFREAEDGGVMRKFLLMLFGAAGIVLIAVASNQ